MRLWTIHEQTANANRFVLNEISTSERPFSFHIRKERKNCILIFDHWSVEFKQRCADLDFVRDNHVYWTWNIFWVFFISCQNWCNLWCFWLWNFDTQFRNLNQMAPKSVTYHSYSNHQFQLVTLSFRIGAFTNA